MKLVRSGSSIKVIDRANKESFFTIEVIRGDIALMNKNGTIAMTRILRADDTFSVYNIDYKLNRSE